MKEKLQAELKASIQTAVWQYMDRGLQREDIIETVHFSMQDWTPKVVRDEEAGLVAYSD